MRLHLVIILGLSLSPVGLEPAVAHRFEHPRQLRIGLDADRILVSMVFDLDPGEPSRTARQLFDRNTDGQIDEDERALLERWMERTALRFFEVSATGPDAAPKVFTFETLRREGHKSDRPSSATETLGLSLLLSAPLPEATSELWLQVKDQEPDQRKHVPLLLDLAPGWALRASSQGEWHPATRQLRRVSLSAGRPLCLHISRGPLPPAAPSSSFSWCLP